MKTILRTSLLILLIAGASRAESVVIRHVYELTDSAEVIARVTILCVINTGAKKGFSKIAYARVTDAIRGVEQDVVFELEHSDAEIGCPNVSYFLGEDVLIFARRMSNGHYKTLYADAGKFVIANNAVSKQPFGVGQSYKTVRAEIKRELLKKQRGNAHAAPLKNPLWW